MSRIEELEARGDLEKSDATIAKLWEDIEAVVLAVRNQSKQFSEHIFDQRKCIERIDSLSQKVFTSLVCVCVLLHSV